MATVILGVGEYGAVRDPGSAIKTYALGSCVGVVVLDPATRCIGMIHVAHPNSKRNEERSKTQPGYFADTGVPALLDCMRELGSAPSLAGVVVKIAGGAKILDLHENLNMGRKNQLAVKKVLWAAGLVPAAEDLGGDGSRTLSVEVDTGTVVVSNAKGEKWEI